MQHQLIGLLLAAPAQRARHGGGDAAAHRALGHIAHQEQHGHHQRYARQHRGAQPRQEPGLDQAGGRLRRHHQDIGPSQACQRGGDGRFKHGLQARIGGAWRRCR
ncbi:hypothetical protein G6F65_014489 [Rhizopus arrhizus]|nr:hypothetical protein G6F65_014489 [Rhizopus arrhizus]